MRHNHEKLIDGCTWQVNQFSASEGLRLLTRLFGLVGSPVAKALQALPAGTSVLDAQLNLDLLASAITELSSRMDDADVLDLVRRLLSGTRADGCEVVPQFDTLFQGRYLTLFKVLAFVVEVNYQVPLSAWLTAESEASAGPAKMRAAP